jgi:hypothetical protein
MGTRRKFESGTTAVFREEIVINAVDRDIVSEVVEEALVRHTKAE